MFAKTSVYAATGINVKGVDFKCWNFKVPNVACNTQ